MAAPPVVLKDESTGRLVVLQPTGDQGAESRLCTIQGRTGAVGLVPVTGGTYPPEAARKLRALVAMRIDCARTGIAAPTAVLTDPKDPSPGGPVAGFICPRVEGVGLDGLTSPAERRGLGLDPWGPAEQARAGAGLASVFRAAERAGVGMCDHNPPNWRYDARTGAFARIDPLAFAFEHRGWHGTAQVRPEALAPELQRKYRVGTLVAERIGVDHERFALAVLMFLLFCDAWPTAYAGAAPDAVERKEFACVSAPARAVVATDVQLKFFALPAGLRNLITQGLMNAPSRRPGPARYLTELRAMAPAARPGLRVRWRLPFGARKAAVAGCVALAVGWAAVVPAKPRPVAPPAGGNGPADNGPVDKGPLGSGARGDAPGAPGGAGPRRPGDPDAWKGLGKRVGDK